MLANVRGDIFFSNLIAASTRKNKARAYLVAVLCITVGMAHAAVAGQETVATAAVGTAESGMGRVRAAGVSTIGVGGRNVARQAALNDALRKVAVLASVPGMAGKLADSASKPRQNPDVRSVPQDSHYSIVREWEKKGQYHVAVSAEVVQGRFDPEKATLRQIPRKKIVVIQFDVANTMHVDDINNIYDGLPSMLAGRMKESGEFLTAYSGRSIPMESGAPQREAIIQIAGETGAQFLIAGVVRNAEVSRERWSLATPFDWSVKIPFGGYRKRHIEVEFFIFDGSTGARQLLRRLDEYAEGDVMVGNNKPFGSSIFLETEFGKAVGRLIDSAVNEIQSALENVPFAAHIIRVEGSKAFLDAGGDALLNSGDELVVYASDTHSPIAMLNGAVIGVTDHAVDTLTLNQISAQFSIGALSEDAEKLGIKAGNIARVNLSEQRNLAAQRMAAQQLAKAQQEAAAEAARVKAEAEQAEAARVKAEKERVKAEKAAKAQALAAAKAAAKAAKLKAQQETKSTRLSAAQKARARALAVRAKAAQKAKAQAAAAAREQSSDQPKNTAEVSSVSAVQETTNPTATEGKSQQAVKEGTAGGKPKFIKLPPKDAPQSKINAKPAAAATEAQSQQAVKERGAEVKSKYIKLPPGDAHQPKIKAKPAAK